MENPIIRSWVIGGQKEGPEGHPAPTWSSVTLSGEKGERIEEVNHHNTFQEEEPGRD